MVVVVGVVVAKAAAAHLASAGLPAKPESGRLGLMLRLKGGQVGQGHAVATDPSACKVRVGVRLRGVCG